jgi:hypothetical protein
MTEPHDDQETRPISVAELLARNGTIGSPPVGGRRRRRRGNDEAVTVAELTGEIPLVDEEQRDDHSVAPGAAINGRAERSDAEPRTSELDEVSDYDPDGDDDYAHYFRMPKSEPAVPVAAEEMRPDPVDDDDDDDDAGLAFDDDEPAHDDEVPAYLRSTRGALFGGHTVADDMADRGAGATTSEATRPRAAASDAARARTTASESARRRSTIPDVPPEPATAEELEEAEPLSTAQQLVRGGWIVLQSIVAVAFGAGLFIAFDQLWKWNNIVALVLSVLVILGLVVAVRIVRKTEDIASTLIAVAVGALVTLGPLALLQSN